MKRSRFGARTRLTREAEQLTLLATGLSNSGSRVEDRYWDDRLSAQVDKLLAAGNDDAFSNALEHLYRANGRAYDELADSVESRAESSTVEILDRPHDALLIAAPLLAWSRYMIQAGSIPAQTLAALQVQLQAHVLARDARLALADYLFSPDQLPRSYCDTAALTAALTEVAVKGQRLPVDPESMQETAQFLSDMRYLVGVVLAPRGAPLFRWQETDGTRETAATQWHAQGHGALQPLLTGCAYEMLLPDAYHAACREADRQARPYSLRASVLYLKTAINLAPADLRAVVAPFHEHRLEEYRVGFTARDKPGVIHGVVWPLLDAEDEASEVPSQIEAVLKEAGVKEIVNLDHRFPMEYCDDCGAPLYPNPDGEPEHAEMPEQEEGVPAQLH